MTIEIDDEDLEGAIVRLHAGMCNTQTLHIAEYIIHAGMETPELLKFLKSALYSDVNAPLWPVHLEQRQAKFEEQYNLLLMAIAGIERDE